MSGRKKTSRKPGPASPGEARETRPAPDEIQAMSRVKLERLARELRVENAGLRHDLELFEELYEDAPAGYVTLDRRGRVLRANATMADLLGLPVGAVGGMAFSRFVTHESREVFLRHQKAVIEQTDGHVCEIKLRRANGDVFVAQLDTKLVSGPSAPTGWCRCFVSDVTERRLASEHHRLVFEQNPQPMWIYDEHTLRILAVNDAASKHYGWTHEEFLRMTLRDMRPPGEVPKLLKAMRKLRGKRLTFAGEWKHWKRDGTVFDAAVTFSCIQFHGRQARLAMIRDVTESRLAQEALRQSEVKFRRLHESMRDASVTVDMNGRIIDHNSAYKDMLGYTAAELRELSYQALTPRKWHRYEAKLVRERVLPHGWSGVYEKEYQRKDGTVFPVELSTFLICDDKGHPAGMWAIVRDISERRRAAEALRESEGRFRHVLEHSVDAAYRRNLQTGGYDYISPAIKGLTGYTPEQIMAQPADKVFEFIHPADVFHVKRAHRQAVKTGKPVRRLEYRFKCRNGTYRWLAESFRLVRDKSGRPRYVVGTVFDISDRKRVEEELRQSQRLARSTVEAIPAIVCVLDPDGTIIDTNQAWRSFARTNGGDRKKTDTGVNYLAVCDHMHGFGEDDAAHFAAGIRAVAAGTKKMFSMEYACHTPAEKRWFTGYVSPFAGLGDRRMVVAHVNITAVKLAEERFRTVIESAPDAMLLVDEAGRIEMMNQKAQQVFGYSPDALVGRKVEQLMPKSARRVHHAHRATYMEAPEARPMSGGRELLARRKDGQEFPAEINLSPLQTATGTLVCAVVRDITERKAAEQAIKHLNEELERRVEERTAALHAANQSLRTEMAGRLRLEREILSFSEAERASIGRDLHDDLGQQIAGAWLLSTVLADNLASSSSPESKNARKLAGILGDALTVTRSLSRGLQPTAIEEGGLVSALGDLAARTHDLFHIPCRFATRLRDVACDSTVAAHLFRIAQESVTNAAKHGRAAHIDLGLHARSGRLRLVITDDGCGIPPEHARNAGLGLRIMRYRADMIGGTLEIRRRPEGGTQVTCTLPHAHSETSARQVPCPPEAKPRPEPPRRNRHRKENASS